MSIVNEESTNPEGMRIMEAKAKVGTAAKSKTSCIPLSGSDETTDSPVSPNIGISAMRPQTPTPPTPSVPGGHTV